MDTPLVNGHLENSPAGVQHKKPGDRVVGQIDREPVILAVYKGPVRLKALVNEHEGIVGGCRGCGVISGISILDCQGPPYLLFPCLVENVGLSCAEYPQCLVCSVQLGVGACCGERCISALPDEIQKAAVSWRRICP